MRRQRSDKGKKREVYDNSRRLRGKRLRDIGEQAKEQAQAEKRAKRKRDGRPKSERRALARLAELPKDMRCPVCSRTKLRSTQWVVDAHSVHSGFTAICRSCFRRLEHGATIEEIQDGLA